MRRAVTTIATIAASLHAADLLAQHTDPLTAGYPADLCPGCAAWNQPQRPFRIYGNTYYAGTRGLSAVLITSPEGHILIDGGLPNSAPLIIPSIRELGFDIADVVLILNSHAHHDHAGGTTWSWESCEAGRCLHIIYADSQTPVSAEDFRFSDSDAYPSAVADFERGFAVLGARGTNR